MNTPLPLNPALAGLPVYQPGRPIEEVARELGIPAGEIIKLASNENPLGPSPKAMEAVRAFLPQSHLYPDGNAYDLKRRLARHLGMEPEHLILGNGSNEIIEFVGHALLQPGDNIVVSQYGFAVYPLVAHLFQAQVVEVPARAFHHDLPAMAAAVNERTRIVFAANPNNPTGTSEPPAAVLDFVRRIPPRVLVVMDEAYIEFLEDAPDLRPLIRTGAMPNLILMRTFSKIYGLAGFRVGYGIAEPGLIQALERIRQPFNLNALAQAAALAALEDNEHLEATRRINRAGLDQLQAGCRRLGLEFVPSHANFVLVRVGDGASVFKRLQQQGVITRPMGGYRLPEWIRISVGTEAENRRCLDALASAVENLH